MSTTQKERSRRRQTASAQQGLDQTRFIDLYSLDGPPLSEVELDGEAIERMLNMIPTREDLAAGARF